MKELVELTLNECLTLLGESVVGRVAMVTPVGLRLLPVNYTMYEDEIIFRTSPSSELGTYAVGSELAFEIDHLDHEKHEGWSVVALGTAEIIDDPKELADIKRHWDPQPWAPGLRHLYLRIVWRDITGRRIGSEVSDPPLTAGGPGEDTL
jgi:nitroimidazol reductase NimA-like FMN-containing flavoprotein (pyridoxamine 5'-phosphate oxidase superfamily)